jgi:hypothetical protein
LQQFQHTLQQQKIEGRNKEDSNKKNQEGRSKEIPTENLEDRSKETPTENQEGRSKEKREIHYQFLKREKDPNKTLNKYFVPWFHQKLYHGFTTSTPPNGHISISLNPSLSCDYFSISHSLSPSLRMKGWQNK